MRRFQYVVFCSALLVMCGCVKTKPPAAESKASHVSVQALPVPHINASDATGDVANLSNNLVADAAYPLPELTSDALLKYIQQLAAQKPRGSTQEDFISDQISRAKSQLIAAERIILDDAADPSLVKAATKAKLDTLRILAILDGAGLGQHFQPFVMSVLRKKSPAMRRLGLVSQLEYEMDRLGLGQEQAPDSLIARVNEVLGEQGIGRAEFLITQYAGIALDQQGFALDATAILKQVADRFADASDSQLAQEAQALLRQTGFREQVTRAIDGGPAEFEQLEQGMQTLLRDRTDLVLDHLDLTLNAAQTLEYHGKVTEAMRIYRAVNSAFEDAEARLAEQAERSLRYAEKRLNVLGEEVSIQGVHADGTPFHWEALKGKVVLVDFWTTWSGPWHEQLSDLETTYDRFHEAGFEVVGVNLDETVDHAYEYLRQRQLPWPNLIAPSGGFGNVNAVRYGVDAVPFAMLVGRNGKVASIHLRGPELERRVKELLDLPTHETAERTRVPK